MKVILTEDVASLGKVGDLVTVADGYGRNFLLPRKKAILATVRSVGQLEHQKKLVQDKILQTKRNAEKLAKSLEGISLTIAKPAEEEEKLFGSVTHRDIEEALLDEGFQVDRKLIQLEEPIRSLGVYTIQVKLHTEVEAKLKIWVVAK